jgi:hypothetical protein
MSQGGRPRVAASFGLAVLLNAAVLGLGFATSGDAAFFFFMPGMFVASFAWPEGIHTGGNGTFVATGIACVTGAVNLALWTAIIHGFRRWRRGRAA